MELRFIGARQSLFEIALVVSLPRNEKTLAVGGGIYPPRIVF